jgi:hypothetical protein
LRAAALNEALASLLPSAVPSAFVSNSVPWPLVAWSAVTTTSNVPVPRAPSGSVKVKVRGRDSPAASGSAAAPLKATAVSTRIAPGVPSALRWRITT